MASGLKRGTTAISDQCRSIFSYKDRAEKWWDIRAETIWNGKKKKESAADWEWTLRCFLEEGMIIHLKNTFLSFYSCILYVPSNLVIMFYMFTFPKLPKPIRRPNGRCLTYSPVSAATALINSFMMFSWMFKISSLLFSVTEVIPCCKFHNPHCYQGYRLQTLS